MNYPTMGLGIFLSASTSMAAPPNTSLPQRVDPSDQRSLNDTMPFPFVFFSEPTKDTFTYPNIGSSGNTRLNGWSTYYPGIGRHSSIACMYDTESMGVPSGESGYVKVLSMEFTAVTYASGPTAHYDGSRDAPENSLWAGGEVNVFDSPGGFAVIGAVHVPADPTYIQPLANEADNAPVELFGVRFNNGLSAALWDESASGTPAYQNGRHNMIPIDFDSDGTQRDVTDNIASLPFVYTEGPFISQPGFDVPAGDEYITEYPTGEFFLRPHPTFVANPFAIGKSFSIPDGTPGHSIFGEGQSVLALNDPIPPAYRLRFRVNVSNPYTQAYLRDSIHDGWITFMFSHLAFGDHAGGAFTYWMTKEGAHKLPPAIDVDPSTLSFEYIPIPFGDMDHSGSIKLDDLFLLVDVIGSQHTSRWSKTDRDLADVNRDGVIDIFDIIELLPVMN